jgi:hypothetical protein
MIVGVVSAALILAVWFAYERTLATSDDGVESGLRVDARSTVDADLHDDDDESHGDRAGEARDAPAGALTVFLEVVDDQAAPIVGAEVAALRATGPFIIGQSDRDGMISFAQSERVPVRVRALGFVEGVFSPPAAGDAKEIGWTITLKPDPTAARTGIVWSRSTAVADALVIAVDADGAPLGRERTDASGRFRLIEGARKLYAAHAWHGAVAHALDSKGSQSVTSAPLVLELPAPAILEGTVRDGSGKPVTQGKVRATSRAITRVLDDVMRRARKSGDDDGRALSKEIAALTRAQETTALSASGAFRIGPIPADDEIAVTASSGDLTPASVEGVSVSPGDTRAGLLLVLDDSGFMRGTVTDRETGAPIAGAVIQVRRFQGVSDDHFGRAVADAEGNYRAPIEPRARLTAQVTARGYLLLEEGGIETRRGAVVTRDFALKRAPKQANRTAREYTGIGTSIKGHPDGVTVLDVFKGPASEVLQKGDVIVRVDGEWIRGLPLQEIVERIKGEPGSDVELTVKRAVAGQPGALEEMELVIARDRIEYQGR